MTHRNLGKIWRVCILFAVVYLAIPPVLETFLGRNRDAACLLMAADAAPAAAPAGAQAGGGESQRTLLRVVLIDSGVWEWFLIILSIVDVAFLIQVFVEQRPEKLLPPGIDDDLRDMFDNEEYEEALNFCEDEDCILSRIVAAGLSRQNAGYDSMMDVIEEIGEQETTLVLQKLSYISLIAAIAPMLGLLGTVVGMIQSFNTIVASRGTADPSMLAKGISTALITTASGLLIAIPTTAAFMFIKNRSIRAILETNIIVNELFDRFRGK